MSWTEQEIDYLRKNYGKIPTKDIAEHLNKTVTAVNMCASRKKISANRYYSQKEIRYLENNLGKIPISEIAKKLGRSKNSVATFMIKNNYGVSREYQPDYLSQAEVCRLVGYDKNTIRFTWCKHGLAIKKVGKFSMIEISNLFEFMENNPQLYDATRCEKWFFEQYSCKWFEEKRKMDFEKMVNARWGKSS